jgi:hypothetical protein
MRKYLSIFSMLGLTLGMIIFTTIFLLGVGMRYSDYKAWMSLLLSFSSLISNAAVGYYFASKPQPSDKK